MASPLTDRPSWTWFALHAIVGSICCLGVFYSQEKFQVVVYSACGAISLARALRVSPIPIGEYFPLLSGIVLLALGAFLALASWRNYAHEEKVVVLVALLMWVPYLLWEYFTRRRARPGAAGS